MICQTSSLLIKYMGPIIGIAIGIIEAKEYFKKDQYGIGIVVLLVWLVVGFVISKISLFNKSITVDDRGITINDSMIEWPEIRIEASTITPKKILIVLKKSNPDHPAIKILPTTYTPDIYKEISSRLASL